MISLQVELIGDRVGVILDEGARAALNVQVGDRVTVASTAQAEARDIDDDGRHQRGKAFLKRYRRSLDGF
jgi:hypothetical protein